MLNRTQNLIATLAAVVVLLVASAGTFGNALFDGAIFDGINSAFNHGFPNFYGGGGATHDTTMSVNTNSIGQLHQTFEGAQSGTYRLDPAIAAVSLRKSEGWHVEARVNAISAPNPIASFQASSAVMMSIDDYEEDKGVIVSFEENAVSVVDDNFQILLQQAHDGGFHTTRISRAPGQAGVDFIFDGQLVGTVAVGELSGEAGRMSFGDGYGASEALWDHVVVNHEVQDTHTRFYEEDNPPAGRAVEVIAKDNFEGHNTGDLVGQTAPTGQTYIVDQALVDSLASTVYAPVQSVSVENTSGKPNGPGQGIGHAPFAGGSARFDAALLPVGELAPGTYRLEFDVYHPGSGSGDPHFWLSDTDGGNKIIVAWEPANGKIHFEGIGYPPASFDIGGNPVGLHLALDVDTINNTAQAIWEDLDGDHIFGETSLQSIPFNFAPDTIGMLINFGGETDLPPGFDNLRLSKLRMVPEPATVTLLGIGGLAMLRRRRAA